MFAEEYLVRAELAGGLPAELGPFEDYNSAGQAAETSDLPIVAFRIEKRYVIEPDHPFDEPGPEPEPEPEDSTDSEPADGDEEPGEGVEPDPES